MEDRDLIHALTLQLVEQQKVIARQTGGLEHLNGELQRVRPALERIARSDEEFATQLVVLLPQIHTALSGIRQEIAEQRAATLLFLAKVQETQREITGKFPLVAAKEDAIPAATIKAFGGLTDRARVQLLGALLALVVVAVLAWEIYKGAK